MSFAGVDSARDPRESLRTSRGLGSLLHHSPLTNHIPVRNRTPSSTFEASRASVTLRGQDQSSGGWGRTSISEFRARRPPIERPRNVAKEGLEPSRPKATAFETAASAGSATWPVQCVGQELNLHSVSAGGLQPLRLANAQPTRSRSKGGSRTHSILGFKARWSADCLPCRQFFQCTLDGI